MEQIPPEICHFAQISVRYPFHDLLFICFKKNKIIFIYKFKSYEKVVGLYVWILKYSI